MPRPSRLPFLTPALLLAACGGSSGGGGGPIGPADLAISSSVLGPNEVLLAWQDRAAGTSAQVFRDGVPISPPLAASSTWVDRDVLSDRQIRYRVEVRDPSGRVVATATAVCRTPATSPDWEVRDLFEAGAVGRCAAAFAADGTFHLAFHDAARGALLLGTEDAGGIDLAEVARGADTGRRADLAIDSQGQPVLAFESAGDLRIARPDGAGGFAVRIAAQGTDPQALALALDADDRAFVVYRAAGDQAGLRSAAELPSGSFAQGAVPALGPTRGDVDLAAPPGGELAVLYFTSSVERSAAHLTTRVGGTWNSERIAEVARPFGALAAGPDGRVHAVLFGAADLVLVSGAPQVGWSSTALDETFRGADQASVAVDVFGDLHVAAHGRARDLVWTSRIDGRFENAFVDADGRVGEGAAIALDARGRPRIVYHDASRGQVRLATAR
jgi:hypothetical protein